MINEVKSFYQKSFDMKDLGEANVILNIKLIKDEYDFFASKMRVGLFCYSLTMLRRS